MKVFPSPAPLALAAALAALLAPPAHADTIVLRNGTKLEDVKVTAESIARVEYRKGKAPAAQTVKSSDVQSIDYGTTSNDFQAGMASRDEGDLETAGSHFMAVADDKDTPAFLRALAMAEAGDAALARGDIDDALQTWSQLLREFPDTRQLPRLQLGKGRALLASGKLDEAAKAFDALKADAASRDYGEHWALAAEFWSLRAGEASGAPDKVKAAAAGYEALRTRAGDKARDVAAQCAVRLGAIQLAANATDKALPLFQAVIDGREGVPRDDLAAAFNGRGRCLFAQAQVAADAAGKLQGDKGKQDKLRADAEQGFKQARLDFLRVFTSYPGVRAQQPEALYWAAQCFLAITDPDGKNPGRAASLLKRCRDQYPGSDWGKKAAQG